MILQAPGKKLVASVGIAGPLNRKRESESPRGGGGGEVVMRFRLYCTLQTPGEILK